MKNFRLLVLLFAATMLVASCSPTTESTDDSQAPEEPVETFVFMENQAPVWQAAIDQIIELSDAMPEEDYSFQPHDSSRTFAEQLFHIGTSTKVIAELFLLDKQPGGGGEMPDPNSMSKEDLVNMVRTGLEETWTIMEAQSDQKLAEQIKSFAGNDMTRLQGALLVHDHLSNHKAKANLYIRIAGHKPPSYRYY